MWLKKHIKFDVITVQITTHKTHFIYILICADEDEEKYE